MSEAKPFTVKSFKDYINEKKLMGSKCKSCGNIDAPVRMICSKCQSTDLEWVELSGKGTLAAFSCISVGTTYFSKLGYSMKKPYCFGIVKLEEGPHVSAQVVGVDETKPETISIGMPLKVTFLERTIDEETRSDLGFEPA
ncbi:MAG: Zn-ribbon domain-containing OB-fold protein [Promethearchaeota archaeon]